MKMVKVLTWRQYAFEQSPDRLGAEDGQKYIKSFDTDYDGERELERFYSRLVSRDPKYVIGSGNIELALAK